MTKADLADAIFEKVGLSKKEAQDIIEIIFDKWSIEIKKLAKKNILKVWPKKYLNIEILYNNTLRVIYSNINIIMN